MKSFECLNRNKLEFDWENEDLHDNDVVKEGQSKLLHPDILAKIPGVELENDYENVVSQAIGDEIVQVKSFAERVTVAKANDNLELDNRIESNYVTGKFKEMETIAIDDSDSDDNDDSIC